MSVVITTTTTYKCICGLIVELKCKNCELLERKIETQDNIIKKLSDRLDEIDNLSKLRQIAIDLMDKYINIFSEKFDVELDSKEIYTIRKSINKKDLLIFDDIFFEKKCTFYQFSNALKNMKRFNKIAHPEYNINEISQLLESYVNNKKYNDIVNFVICKFLN